jgi:integrase
LVRPEGDLDFRLVEYFTRSLEFTGLADTSKVTYANELRTWFEFLRVTDRGEWDEATVDLFLEFRTWRLHTAENEGRVSPATFKKAIPALKGFYGWAVSRGYVVESPVPEARFAGSPGLTPKNARASRDRWVLPRTYGMWRNVGLLDYAAMLDSATLEVRASGARTPAARGRNQIRNVAYTDLLLTSALRNRELSHLLLSELPATPSAEAILPSTLAKGARDRAWMVLSPHPLAAVDLYVRSVRRAQVMTARARGAYEGPQWIEASALDTAAGVLMFAGGRRRSLESLTVQERPRLLVETESGREPLMLWLYELGIPMDARSWGNVFTKGNARVAAEYGRLGVRSAAPRVSAHSLRFTCALFTLLAFVQVIDERLGVDPVEPWVEARYTEAFDFVREFLGHAADETTKGIYLKPVRDLRRLNAIGRDRTLPSLMDWLAQESALVANPKVQL